MSDQQFFRKYIDIINEESPVFQQRNNANAQKWAKENPEAANYAKLATDVVTDYIPGISQVKSAYRAGKAALGGDYGEAGKQLVGTFVPGGRRMVGAVDAGLDAAKGNYKGALSNLSYAAGGELGRAVSTGLAANDLYNAYGPSTTPTTVPATQTAQTAIPAAEPDMSPTTGTYTPGPALQSLTKQASTTPKAPEPTTEEEDLDENSRMRKYLDMLDEGPPPGVGPNATRQAPQQQLGQPDTFTKMLPGMGNMAIDAVGGLAPQYAKTMANLTPGSEYYQKNVANNPQVKAQVDAFMKTAPTASDFSTSVDTTRQSFNKALTQKPTVGGTSAEYDKAAGQLGMPTVQQPAGQSPQPTPPTAPAPAGQSPQPPQPTQPTTEEEELEEELQKILRLSGRQKQTTNENDSFKKFYGVLNESMDNDEVDLHDSFDIELNEHFVIETGIVGFTKDGIIIEADETVLDLLELNSIICEDETMDQREEEVAEAEYQGRKVPLGKPMAGDVKKSKVYVKKPNGKVVKVNFGDKNMKIKKSNPNRRKSFRARHRCENPGPRWKARYWSCRAW
jgi:hypothetical protein